jgi:hypothetical protein
VALFADGLQSHRGDSFVADRKWGRGAWRDMQFPRKDHETLRLFKDARGVAPHGLPGTQSFSRRTTKIVAWASKPVRKTTRSVGEGSITIWPRLTRLLRKSGHHPLTLAPDACENKPSCSDASIERVRCALVCYLPKMHVSRRFRCGGFRSLITID